MDEEYDTLAYQQRLKAAVHYTVGRMCGEIATEKEVTFSKQFIAALSESTYRQAQSMATDLELFAKHAKRSTINQDDVKLLVRKTPPLLEYIEGMCKEQTAANVEKRGKQKGRKKKSMAAKGKNTDQNDPPPSDED